MDRRETVRLFQARLASGLARMELNRSEFARQVGIDRSTLSQLLSPATDRLPRAETVAAIANLLQVSTDWLLGLSQDAQRGADILEQSVRFEGGSALDTDALLARWRAEAAGYKIRYVPTNLPDLVKTPELIRYEYEQFAARTPDQALRESEDQRQYSRLSEAEFEICCAIQELESFAGGVGIWRGLDVALRRRQLQAIIAMLEELYPTVRWFLYDGRTRYSAPLTIFGPTRAAVYMGQMYFVFNTTEHIRLLTRHFDELIRAAVVQPPDVPAVVQGLLDELDGDATR